MASQPDEDAEETVSGPDESGERQQELAHAIVIIRYIGSIARGQRNPWDGVGFGMKTSDSLRKAKL